MICTLAAHDLCTRHHRPVISTRTDDDLAHSTCRVAEYWREACDVRASGFVARPRGNRRQRQSGSHQVLRASRRGHERHVQSPDVLPGGTEPSADRRPAADKFSTSVIDGDTIERGRPGGHSYYHTMAICARVRFHVRPFRPRAFRRLVRRNRAPASTTRRARGRLVRRRSGARCPCRRRHEPTEHMGSDVVIVDALYGVRCMLGMTGIGSSYSRARSRQSLLPGIKYLGEILWAIQPARLAAPRAQAPMPA